MAWASIHALNTEGLKAGSVYALNRKYALNNGVHLTTRVYSMRWYASIRCLFVYGYCLNYKQPCFLISTEAYFMVRVCFLSPLLRNIVKLTAMFVARNGAQFMDQLMMREQKNEMFDFLRKNHILFSYFIKLVEQYTKVCQHVCSHGHIRLWQGYVSPSILATQEIMVIASPNFDVYQILTRLLFH